MLNSILSTRHYRHTHTHTHPFNGPFSGVSQYQKGKTNLDFTEARDSESSGISRAICKCAPRSRQITMPVTHHSSFLQAGCPSYHMAQLMPLPVTVSCFSKIQTGFTFLVPAHPGSPRQIYKSTIDMDGHPPGTSSGVTRLV